MQKKTKIILLLIVLLGSFLRIYQLGKESFCIDELLTASKSSKAIFAVIKYWFSAGHFPTYYILMHYWMKLFGTGEFAVRLPSAVFGILSIYIIFLLGRRLFDEKTSLLASYLFAVSTIIVYYSQYAKPYSMAVLFVLLSFLFFFEVLEKNTKPFWFGYIFFTLFALLSSASTIPILICQLLFVVLTWSRYKRHIKVGHLIAVFVIILVIYLPVLFNLIAATSKKGKIVIAPLDWLCLPSLRNILDIFNLFGVSIFRTVIGANPIRSPYLIISTNIFGITLFLLCLRGIFSLRRSIKGLFLSLWLIGPIALPFIFSYIVSPVFGPVRYVLYVSGVYYLLVGKGIMCFENKRRILLIIFIVLMGFMFLKEFYHTEKNTNWKKICQYIKENISDNEKVGFIANNSWPISYSAAPMLLYYSVPNIIGISNIEDFKKIPKRDYDNTSVKWYIPEELTCNSFWLVTESLPSLSGLHSEIIKRLENKYILLEDKEFQDIRVYHYKIEGTN